MVFQFPAGLCPAGQPRAAVPTWFNFPACFQLRAAAILLECFDEAPQSFCWPGFAVH